MWSQDAIGLLKTMIPVVRRIYGFVGVQQPLGSKEAFEWMNSAEKVIKDGELLSPMITGLHSDEPEIYQHYKGGLYTYLGVATLESDGKVMVVYRDEIQIWVRPYDEFFGFTETNLRRFLKVPMPYETDAASI